MRRLLYLLVFALSLAGCASGPPKRVFPPQVRIQELTRQTDEQWRMALRVENFSNVPMRFDRLDAGLQLAGADAGRLALPAELEVGPGSAEIVAIVLTAPAGVQSALERSLSKRSGVRYRLEGSIHSADPRGEHPLEYESTLDPVPGLDGVLR